jgi:hypothetical protein
MKTMAGMSFQLAFRPTSATIPHTIHISPTNSRKPGLEGRRPATCAGVWSLGAEGCRVEPDLGVTRPRWLGRRAMTTNRSFDVP